MTRFALLFTVCGIACGPGTLDWRNHASFRATGTGKSLAIAQIDPSEHVTAGVSRNLQYVAITLDSVFFRDLPGLQGRTVAMGVELDGVLPDKKVKGVIDVKETVAKHAFLSFDNVALVEPFLYTGRPITITLHFRAIPKTAVPVVSVSTLARLGIKLDPTKSDMLDLANEKFAQVLGAAAGGERSWTYSFTLFPVDTTYKDKPEMLFTATRHILVAIPPVDASKALRQKLNPYKLIESLKMRGNRLVHGDTNDEFTESPYIVLNITRFKRYPKAGTALGEAIERFDKFMAERNFEVAKGQLRMVGVELSKDKVLTTRERNLESARNEIREASLQAELDEVKAREKEAAGAKEKERVASLDKALKAMGLVAAPLRAELADLEKKKKETVKVVKAKFALKAKLDPILAEETRLKAERAAIAGGDEARPLWESAAKQHTKSMRLASAILVEHAEILEPFEIVEIAGFVKRLATRTDEIQQKLSQDAAETRAIVAAMEGELEKQKKKDDERAQAIAALQKGRGEFEEAMKRRLEALEKSDQNRARARYRPKWYEKAWVWSAITVGTLGITGTVLYFVLKTSPNDQIIGTLPPGGLSFRP